ncbi:MAG: K(+)-transporting ATPase subunit C [Cyanobacteria bacterium]|nr:K(+)-transporting ATPase subunit C [Cyanobacteriota bacterium]
MNIAQDLFKSIRIVAVLWILTAVLYPLLTWGIGQTLFSNQANGSLVLNAEGKPIGSTLIGQPFKSDRYFWSRPSTIEYGTLPEVAKTGASGASNLAPSNPALFDRIKPEAQRLRQANIKPTPDMLYTSGSGLDPHISLESAQAQIPRLSQARGMEPSRLQELINQAIDDRILWILGEPGVNVLKLNLSLDQK